VVGFLDAAWYLDIACLLLYFLLVVVVFYFFIPLKEIATDIKEKQGN